MAVNVTTCKRHFHCHVDQDVRFLVNGPIDTGIEHQRVVLPRHVSDNGFDVAEIHGQFQASGHGPEDCRRHSPSVNSGNDTTAPPFVADS